jgi:hypothetical protein
MDRGDAELVDTACVSALAEYDYREFRHEQERQKAKVRG